MLYALITGIEEIAIAQDVDIDLGIAPAILQKEQSQDRFCKNNSEFTGQQNVAT